MNEIEKLVFERYPLKEKEKTCLSFKIRMNGLRDAYRKRLINDNGKQSIEKIRQH